MNHHPFPPLPWHLFATITSLITGITIGRFITLNIDSISAEWEFMTRPQIIALITLITTVIAITISLIAIRRKIVYHTIMLIALAMLGTTLIRLHDVYTQSTYSQQSPSPSSSGFMIEQRQKLADIYSKYGLKGDEKAIVTAMTLGEKKDISRTLKRAYSISGAAHVLALSGLHLSILFAILTFIMPRKRFPVISSLIIMFFIWSYTMLVGCHASIIRAAVMMTIYVLIPLKKNDNRSHGSFYLFSYATNKT